MTLLTGWIAGKQLIPSQGKDVIIPDIYTSIKSDAFSEAQITSIVIPDSVTSIGDRAFTANQMTSVVIPNSVTSIGDHSFAYNRLTSVELNHGLKSIGAEGFYGNLLSSVIFPYGLTTIGRSAFENNHLKSIDLNHGLTSIGDNAFAHNELTSTLIPDSVTSIGISAFSNNRLKGVVIPENVTSIGDRAFASNQLTYIVIPDGVTSIGNSVFKDNQLTNVTIPDGVTSIGDSAFEYNELTSIVIPNGVTSIGDSAFANNRSTSIDIPNGVTSIGDAAYRNNQLTNVVIPDGITSIGAEVFQGNQLSSVIIPDGVTSIGDSAFAYNELTSIVIPDSVTSIEANAFKGNKISSVTVPDSVTTILGNAFDDDVEINGVPINIVLTQSPATISESIKENSDPGIIINIEADYYDGSLAHSYSLIDGIGGEDNRLFQVIGNQIQFMNSTDFETKSSYSLLLQTSSWDGRTKNHPIILNVEDINESPTALTVSPSDFNENIREWEIVASLSSTDVDAGDSHNYKLVDGEGDDDNSAFMIVRNNQLMINHSPDFETKSSYSVRIQTKDSRGLTFEKAFTLSVNDLVETPFIQSIDNISTQTKITTFKSRESINLSGSYVDTVIVGTKKKDKIAGTSIAEIITGREGRDVLTGGKGTDGFVFHNAGSFGKKNADIIKDFHSNDGDSILIDQKDFDIRKTIYLNVVKTKREAKKAHKSIEDFVYDEKKGLLYFNENGKEKGWGDGGLFVKLQGAPELGTNDFTIV